MPALLCDRPTVSNRAAKPSVPTLNTNRESRPSLPETESGEPYSTYTAALRVAEENEDFEAACKVLSRWFGMIGSYHAKAIQSKPDTDCDLQFWPMCQQEAKTALALYRKVGKEKRAAIQRLQEACLPHYAQALASGDYSLLGL